MLGCLQPKANSMTQGGVNNHPSSFTSNSHEEPCLTWWTILAWPSCFQVEATVRLDGTHFQTWVNCTSVHFCIGITSYTASACRSAVCRKDMRHENMNNGRNNDDTFMVGTSKVSWNQMFLNVKALLSSFSPGVQMSSAILNTCLSRNSNCVEPRGFIDKAFSKHALVTLCIWRNNGV